MNNYLKGFRMRMGMNQKEMANKLDISPSMLSNIEHEKAKVPNYVLSRFQGTFQFFLNDGDYQAIYQQELEYKKKK